MGNRISTEDLYKITQSLADRAVSDVKKKREDERKREEAIKKNREERLAAAAKQKRLVIITKIITRLKMRPAFFIISCPPIFL